MERSEIIIFAAVMVFAAFRLYQKYGKKSQTGSGSDKKPIPGCQMTSSPKDDDYEPYSKK